jgi:hypothetical protein
MALQWILGVNSTLYCIARNHDCALCGIVQNCNSTLFCIVPCCDSALYPIVRSRFLLSNWIKLLCKFESIFKTALAHESGDQEVPFKENNHGSKILWDCPFNNRCHYLHPFLSNEPSNIHYSIDKRVTCFPFHPFFAFTLFFNFMFPYLNFSIYDFFSLCWQPWFG